MPFAIPEHAVRFGFVTTPTSAHSGKTMLLPELSLLMGAAAISADYSTFRELVIEENVTLKATSANRKGIFKTLATLYGLREDLLLFRALNVLWADAGVERPLLTILLASARDSALRCSSEVILAKQDGELVSTDEIETVVVKAFGDRYTLKTRRSMAEHLNGSWTQSGHLTGGTIKRRTRAVSGPASVTYALLLGYLCGARGVMLYQTSWARLLDLAMEQIDAQAFAAAQRGWLSYRRIGDVAEISFPLLLAGVREGEFTK